MKRSAAKEINKDNVDDVSDDDESEVKLGIPKASEEKLARRQIIRAVRPTIKTAGAPASKPNGGSTAFSGFGGFGGAGAKAAMKATVQNASVKPTAFFSGMPALPKPAATTPPVASSASTTSSASVATMPSGPLATSAAKPTAEVLAQRLALNKSFAEWVTKSIKEDYACDLSPAFADYTSHIERIGATKSTKSPTAPTSSSFGANSHSTKTATSSSSPASSSSSPAPAFSFGAKKKKDDGDDAKASAPAAAATPAFLFGAQKKKDDGDDAKASAPAAAATPAFSFGAKKKDNDEKASAPAAAATPAFSFGAKKTGEASASGSSPPAFSFGVKPAVSSDGSAGEGAAKKPAFSFGAGLGGFGKSSTSASTATGASGFAFNLKPGSGAGTASVGEKEDEGDAGEEFKGEISKEVKAGEVTGEEGETTVGNYRCKMFIDKAGEWTPKGVGELKVNENGESKKRRALMRSDGNGIVLFNTFVSSLVGVSVVDGPKKTNVSLALPDEQGKLQKYLVRFKSEADAAAFVEAVKKK